MLSTLKVNSDVKVTNLVLVKKDMPVPKQLLQEGCFAFEALYVGNYGRTGALQQLSLATRAGDVYDFDIIGAARGHPMVAFLREVLECKEIVKVVHGSAMKADSLKDEFGIELASVYDTQVACEVSTNVDGVHWNDLCSTLGFGTQGQSDFNVALLTKLLVADKQISDAAAKGVNLSASVLDVTAKRMDFITKAKIYEMKPHNMGKFVGNRGKNMRKLSKASGTFLSRTQQGTFIVYFNEGSDLSLVDKVSDRVE